MNPAKKPHSLSEFHVTLQIKQSLDQEVANFAHKQVAGGRARI